MLRSVTLGLVLSVLVAACALFSEPIPAGTVAVQVVVANNSGQERVVSVVSGTDPTGDAIPGAVQPSDAFPANSEANVTLYVPVSGAWAILIPGWGTIPSIELTSIRACRMLVIDIEADAGSGGLGCGTP